MNDLGTLPGGANSSAYAINDAGQVCGSSDGHAAVWMGGVASDVGGPGASSVALAINGRGHAAGLAGARPVLFADGVVTDLLTLPGFSSGQANGIDDADRIVGTVSQPGSGEVGGVSHAFIWQDGAMIDLNTLIDPGVVELLSASAIDASGRIVGLMKPVRLMGAGGPHAFLLTPDTGNEETIFDQASPPVPAYDDPNAVTLGVRFQSDVDGVVESVRFYRGVSDPAGYSVALWDATNPAGGPLGVSSVTSDTTPGWQVVPLSPPVAISANQPYIASYYTTVGQYAVEKGGLQSAIGGGHVTTLASGAGGNGVFAYGALDPGVFRFPAQSSDSGDNYWVDVVFRACPAGL